MIVTIGGVVMPKVLIDLQAMQITKRLNQRETATFGVLGSIALNLKENMPVSIDDPIEGNLFTGFIDSIENDPITNTVLNAYIVTCKPMRYLADKRYYTGEEFLGAFSGDIVCLMHSQVLAQEGILANYMQEYVSTASDWNTGILTTAMGDMGSLTLGYAGSSVVKSYPDANAWLETGATLTHAKVLNNSITNLVSSTISGASALSGSVFTVYQYSPTPDTGANGHASSSTSGAKYTITVACDSEPDPNGFGLTYNRAAEGHVTFTALGSPTAFLFDCDITITNSKAVPDGNGNFVFNTWYISFGGIRIFINVNYKQLSLQTGAGFVASPTITLNSGTVYHLKVSYIPGRTIIYWNNATTPTIDYTEPIPAVVASNVVYVYYYVSTSFPASITCSTSINNIVMVPLYMPAIWTGPSTLLTSVGTIGSSNISWSPGDLSGSNLSYVVEASLDGGTTWLACSNGGTITGCTVGLSVVGKSLLIRAKVMSYDYTAMAALGTLRWQVVQSYAPSGNRVSLSFPVSAMNYVGGSSISWSQTTPVGTTAQVQISTNDGATYTDAVNGSTIPGLNDQPPLFSDDFDSDTSANYTLDTYGTATSFTITPSTHQLTTTGGSYAQVIWSLYDIGDGDIYGVVSRSDSGGVIFRYQDHSNFYCLHLADASAGVNPQYAWLTKRVAGVDTTIVTTTHIAFMRGEYHTYQITLRGSNITIFYDGVEIMTGSDTSLPLAGNIGYFTNGGTNSWYAPRLQLLGSLLNGVVLKSRIYLTTADITITPHVDNLAVTIRDSSIARGSKYATTSFSYQTSVGGAIDTMATQSSVYWYVDRFKHLFFRMQTSTMAPWVLSSSHGDILDATQPKILSNSPLYRNRQFIYNAIQVSTRAEIQLGDGSTQAWNLMYPVYGLPTVTVNGKSKSVGLLGRDQGKDFYYEVGSTSITQDVNGLLLLATDSLTFTYPAGLPYASMRESISQQSLLQSIDGSSGIVEYAEDGTQAMNSSVCLQADADALAQARIDEYAQLTSTFSYLTMRSGLDVGMLQVIYAPEFGILNESYLVTGISTDIQQKSDGTLLLMNTVDCINGAFLGSWHTMFVDPV